MGLFTEAWKNRSQYEKDKKEQVAKIIASPQTQEWLKGHKEKSDQKIVKEENREHESPEKKKYKDQDSLKRWNLNKEKHIENIAGKNLSGNELRKKELKEEGEGGFSVPTTLAPTSIATGQHPQNMGAVNRNGQITKLPPKKKIKFSEAYKYLEKVK